MKSNNNHLSINYIFLHKISSSERVYSTSGLNAGNYGSNVLLLNVIWKHARMITLNIFNFRKIFCYIVAKFVFEK